MLRVTFCGASRTVTGSMYYFEYTQPGQKPFNFCVDSGMFQVGSNLSLYKTNSHLLFQPKNLDCIILTHGHLDHCGRIPYLIKKGFGGKIYSTPATKKIAEVVMTDAAHISTDEPTQPQYYFSSKGMSKEELNGDNSKVEEISLLKENYGLYQDYHVELSMLRFVTVEYNQKFKISQNLEVEFYDAGHILGSAYVVITEISSGRKIALSGDLGNRDKPIIEDPLIPKNITDVTHIFVETTYGHKLHGKVNPKMKLREIVFKTIRRKGQVLIPSFSVERAQEIIYYLVELMRSNKLRKVPIYLDSPMAGRILEIVLDHPELFDKQLKEKIDQNSHPLIYEKLRVLQTASESKTLNSNQEPCIIIAGSGMLNGGRIIKHLKFHLQNSNNSLIFVGYQAEGTLGREILDGNKTVVIENKEYKVELQVEKINEFSAHADQKILRDWLNGFLINSQQEKYRKKTVFLLHGEKSGADGLKAEIVNSFQDRVVTKWPFFGQKEVLWED